MSERKVTFVIIYVKNRLYKIDIFDQKLKFPLKILTDNGQSVNAKKQIP